MPLPRSYISDSAHPRPAAGCLCGVHLVDLSCVGVTVTVQGGDTWPEDMPYPGCWTCPEPYRLSKPSAPLLPWQVAPTRRPDPCHFLQCPAAPVPLVFPAGTGLPVSLSLLASRAHSNLCPQLHASAGSAASSGARPVRTWPQSLIHPAGPGPRHLAVLRGQARN